MADPQRFIPITIKLDMSQLKNFETQAKTTQEKINQTHAEGAKSWKRMTAEEVKEYNAAQLKKKYTTTTASAEEVKIWEKANRQIIANETRAGQERINIANRVRAEQNKIAQQQARDLEKSFAKGAERSPLSFRGINIPGTNMTDAQKSQFAQYAAGTAIAAAATTGLVAIVVHATKVYAEYGAEIYRVSQQTGIGAKDLSVLRVVAEQTGRGFKETAQSLGMFSRLLYAGEGVGPAADKARQKLQILGIDTAKLKAGELDMLGALKQASKGMQDHANGIEKAGVARQVFGRSGQAAIVFLNEFTSKIDVATKATEAMGLMFSDQAAKKAYEFTQQLKALDQSTKGLEMQLGAAFLPLVLRVINGLAAAAQALSGFVRTFPNLTAGIVGLTIALGAGTTAMLALAAAGLVLDIELGGIPLIIGAIVSGLTLLGGAALMSAGQVSQIDIDFKSLTLTLDGVQYGFKNSIELMKAAGLAAEVSGLKARRASLDWYLLAASAAATATGGLLGRGMVADIQKEMGYLDDAIKLGEGMLKNLKQGAGKKFGAPDNEKAAKEASQNAAIEADKALAIAAANERYRQDKASIDKSALQWKISYDQRLVTTAEYYKQERELAGQAADAELRRNREDIVANRDARRELEAQLDKKQKPAEEQAISNKLKKNQAEYLTLIGKQSDITGELSKKILELGAAKTKQAEADKNAALEADIRYRKSLGGTQGMLASIDEANRKLDEVKDKYGVDAWAGVQSAIDMISAATKEVNKLETELGTGQAIKLSAAMKTAALDEQQIRQGVTLGLYNETQARDMVLAAQRRAIPALQDMIALQKRIADANPGNAEELQKLREYELQLQTMGVDLEAVAREGRIVHQMDIMPEHLNDNVRDFLSNVTTMQQSLENFRTNIVKGVFSEVDKQLDRISSKMGPFKAFFDSTFGQLLKEQAHLQLAKQFEKIFGVKLPQSPQQQQIASTNNLTTSNVNLKSSIDQLASVISGGASGGGDATTRPRTVAGISALSQAFSSASGSSGFSGGSASGGGKAAVIGQGFSVATSPAGKSALKSVFSKLPGLSHLFGSKSSSGGGSSPLGGFSTDEDGGGGMHEAGHANDAGGSDSGKAAGAMMGLGFVQNFTNSGGKMGAVESGMMQAGMSLGATPAGWALMAGAIGLGLAGKLGLYGKSDQKAIHDAIKSDPLYGGLDIKDSKIIDQIKQIGDQQWPGKVKQHVAQLIHEDQVKQLIDSFAQYDLKNNPNYQNSLLARTRHLSDINASENQFIRRANGGQIFAGVPTLMGERRAELVTPNIGGMVHKDANAALDDLSARISARMQKQGGASSSDSTLHHTLNGVSSSINALMEVISGLVAAGPDKVLMTGIKQAGQNFHDTLIDTLRSPGTSSRLNKALGR